MRRTILAPAVSLAALLAVPAAAAVTDFRLPGDPAQQQPAPDRQGPVAPDVPESRGPAPTPTPTAARQPAPTPAPTAAAPPIVLPDLADSAPPRARATRTPTTTSTTTPADPPTAAAPLPDAVAADGLGLPAAEATPSALPSTPVATNAAAPEEASSSAWLWVVAALAALGALGFTAAWAWRRRPLATPGAVPQLERPRLAPAPPEGALPEPLQVALEPLRLSLTLMNATLAYRLEVANRGAAPISDLRIGADMIAAHASMTREQQLSGPGDGAAVVQRIERIEPGESRIVEGEFRVPFSQIVPIRQGNAALLLPLARFRLEAEGSAPVVRTFAVGLPGAKAALQPFRLDLGPRVYPKLTQRAFA